MRPRKKAARKKPQQPVGVTTARGVDELENLVGKVQTLRFYLVCIIDAMYGSGRCMTKDSLSELSHRIRAATALGRNVYVGGKFAQRKAKR